MSRGAGHHGKRPSEWAAEHSKKMEQDKGEYPGLDMDTDDKGKCTQKGGRKGTIHGQLDAMAFPSGSATKEWFAGLMVPSTYAITGEADTWRKVNIGEKCPFSARIAQCIKEESQMRQH